MRRTLGRTVIVAAALSVSCAVTFWAGCGGNDAGSPHSGGAAPGSCVPGQQIACACPGGTVTGAQVCNAAGNGYGACMGCGTMDASVEGTGSDGGDAAVEAAAIGDAAVPDAATDAGGDGSAFAIAPSCVPGGEGMTNCGVDGGESCCTSLQVVGNDGDAGAFYRTYANAGTGPTSEADPAIVSTFRLDKYLITVGRFRQYVSYVTSNAGAAPSPGSGKHAHLNGGDGLNATGGGTETGWLAAWDSFIATGPSGAATWNTNLTTACTSTCADTSTCPSIWTASPGANENMPLNCINWYEAYAFCIWDGGFLPTEAEWEYAAAGGTEQREYPWGSTDPGTANLYAVYGCDFPNGSGACTGAPNSVTSLTVVGSAPLGAARWGQLDMAGEFWESNLDSYVGTYSNPCVNCVDVPDAGQTSARGGAYYREAAALVPSYIGGWDQAGHGQDHGARCARSP